MDWAFTGAIRWYMRMGTRELGRICLLEPNKPLTVSRLSLGILVIGVHGENVLEVGARLVDHPQHHLGHRQIVSQVEVVGVSSREFGEGRQRPVEIALEALDQPNLVLSIDVFGVQAQNLLESRAGLGITA